MAENQTPEQENREQRSLNFVEQIVWDDLQAGKTADVSTPVSHPNPTGIST